MYYDSQHHPYTGLAILYEAYDRACGLKDNEDHIKKIGLLIDTELDAVAAIQKKDTKEYLKPAITPVKPRGK